MRVSRFWQLMDDEFGASYAGHLARNHHLRALGGRTVLEALDTDPPRDVWLALCEDMDVPEERRLGRDDPAPR